MTLKKLLFFLLFLPLTNLQAQTSTSFMVVNSLGDTFEVDAATCSLVPLSRCSGGSITAIALLNSVVYFSDGYNLYRYPYNTAGTCEFLTPFPALGPNVTSLTSGPDGLIYAAAGSTILSYDSSTNVITNLGNLPSQWTSSGDLIFYGNDLLLTTNSGELIKIDLNNLSNSHSVLPFPPNTTVYGMATISAPCSPNTVYAFNITSTSSTQLMPLNLVNNTVTSSSCALPFMVYDAASLSENGSSGYVTPLFSTVAPICSGETLTALPSISTNSITGVWSPALNNTATTTYTFTPDAGQCAATITLTITVNPLVTPTFVNVPTICSGDTLSPLPTTSTNGITGTWSPSLNNTATTTYTFTPTTGLCATTATMIITVAPSGTTLFTPIAPICYGDTGLQLPTTSTNGITGTWTPAENNTETTTYTFTPTNGSCATTATMTVSVIPLIAVALNPTDLCIDSQTQLPKYPVYLATNLNQPNYSYTWYLNGNVIVGAQSNTLLLQQAGDYAVAITDTVTQCVTLSNTVTVNPIQVIHDFTIEVMGEFTSHASISITPYASQLLYQIDELPFQSSNVFENVSYGFHSLSVTDAILCTEYSGICFVPGYPKYFTPNADGYHDSWNVFGFGPNDVYTLQIFDRYGKFIQEINNRSDGWDGTLNGNPLPATDYWFAVHYYLNNQAKTFKGHFSLKR